MLCIGTNQANQRGIGPGGPGEATGWLQPGCSRGEGADILPLLKRKNKNYSYVLHVQLFCWFYLIWGVNVHEQADAVRSCGEPKSKVVPVCSCYFLFVEHDGFISWMLDPRHFANRLYQKTIYIYILLIGLFMSIFLKILPFYLFSIPSERIFMLLM